MTRHRNCLCSIRARRHTPYGTPSVHSGAGLPGIDHHTNSSLSEREESKNARALVRASNTQASERRHAPGSKG